MSSRLTGATLAGVLAVALRYLLWLVTAALGVVDLLSARTLLLMAYVALRLGKWGMGFADKAGFVVMGLVLLVLVFLVEAWYRDAAERGMGFFLRRFAIVTVGQIIFALPFLYSIITGQAGGF